MNPETLMIDNQKYVREDSVIPKIDPSKIKIVPLPRGWIFVGEVNVNGADLTISRAAVIRVWGTKQGLGEIAFNGPTSSTVLDHCPPINTKVAAVIFQMDCDGSKWEKHLK